MGDLLSMFRSDIGKARAKLHKVREDLDRARRRWEELRTLPLPAENYADCFLEMLDRRAENLQRTLLLPRFLSLGNDMIEHGGDSPGLQSSTVLSRNQGQVSGPELETLVVLMLRPQLRALLIDTLKKSGHKCGPARGERQAELDQLGIRMKDLEQQEKTLAAEFAALQRELDV